MDATDTRKTGQLVPLREAAERVCMSTRFLRDQHAAGQLAFVRLSRRIFVEETELVRFIAANTVQHASVRQVRAAAEGRSATP